jgi:hypothetical protein
MWDAIHFHVFKARSSLTCQRKLKKFLGGRLTNMMYEDSTLLVWLKISPT